MIIYVVTGEIQIDPTRILEVGYTTLERAQQAAQYIPKHRIRRDGLKIEKREYTLPPDSIPDGSTISVELHRGSKSDDEGIHHGGEWREFIGIAHIDHIELWHDAGVHGHLSEIGTDKFIQNMKMHVGVSAFPYRRAKIIRKRTDRENGGY